MGGIFVWFKKIVEMEDGMELTKSTLMLYSRKEAHTLT
jgi:hypothetical protein